MTVVLSTIGAPILENTTDAVETSGGGYEVMQSYPDIVALDDNLSVLVWGGPTTSDSGSTSGVGYIDGQIIDNSGAPIGSKFSVSNDVPADYAFETSVASLSNGTFAVTWNYGGVVEIFNLLGSPVASIFGTGDPYSIGLQNGTLAITNGITGSIYTDTGILTSSFTVDPSITDDSNQYSSVGFANPIATLADGNFVIAGASPSGVQMQIFSPDGSTLSPPIEVAAGSDDFVQAVGGSSAGTFMVEWIVRSQTNPWSVMVQGFNDSGQSLGPAVPVEPIGGSVGQGAMGTITDAGAGRFLVTWWDLTNYTLDAEIVASDGSPISNTVGIAHSDSGYASATIVGNEAIVSWSEVGLGMDDYIIPLDILPCFCTGTMIGTSIGDVAVEDLREGGLVVTSSGESCPIKWIGHRKLDCTRHPDPKSVWPIRVSAGAFGLDRPSRDLWLSPGHNIDIGSALAPISAFVNGKSVAQIERGTVEYWHIELDAHDILIAENLPAESYLDTGNRTAFVNGGAFIEAHPDFMPKYWAETCMPLLHDGPQIIQTRTLLLTRLKEVGQATTSDADLHMIADGARIEPIKFAEWRFGFAVAAGCADIRLMSRTFIPAHTVATSADPRSLGVCVGRLQLDGEDIALDDEARFREGWHLSEPGLRWTTGSTPLPARTRLIVINLAGDGCYWQEPRGNVVPVFGQQEDCRN